MAVNSAEKIESLHTTGNPILNCLQQCSRAARIRDRKRPVARVSRVKTNHGVLIRSDFSIPFFTSSGWGCITQVEINWRLSATISSVPGEGFS